MECRAGLPDGSPSAPADGLSLRGCAAYELFQPHICCAMSLRHPLAHKSFLTVQDLYGEELMLIQRGWNQGFDRLRDNLQRLHPQVHIIVILRVEVQVQLPHALGVAEQVRENAVFEFSVHLGRYAHLVFTYVIPD